MRTLRIPDDGKHYPLPPGLGVFPLRRVADYADRVPESWREHGGVFLPIYQREAMWLSFSAAHWRPNAIKVAVGKVNALSGRPWSEKLEAGGRVRGEGAQDYMVVPDQPWLDGINAGGGSTIKQFVAMPLGMGYTVEGQVTGEETHGGLQLCVFEPKSGCFPDTAPAPARYRRSGGVTQDFGDFGGSIMKAQGVSTLYASTLRSAPTMAFNALAAESFVGQEMGLAAGGRMKQSIYPDRHGIECWDESNHARVFIHLVNSHMWQKITGEAIPATPVDARTYANHGYPWFDLYDEHLGDINAAAELDGVKSVKEMDEGKGFKPQQDDGGIDVADAVVQKLPLTLSDISPYGVGDGEW
jgi:hypothetical protein